MSNLPTLLLEALVAHLKRNKINLYVYQVGSSVYDLTKNPIDLDILIIDPSSSSNRFKKRFECLANNFDSTNVFNNSIDAASHSLKQVIKTVSEEFLSDKENVSIHQHFCIGPYLPLQSAPYNLQIDLHICGDLSITETSSFSRFFPYIYLAFLNKNNCLLGPPLSSIIARPSPNSEEYMAALAKTAIRGLKSGNLTAKWKAIKKVNLIKYLHLHDSNSYEKMERDMLSMTMTHSFCDSQLTRIIESTGSKIE